MVGTIKCGYQMARWMKITMGTFAGEANKQYALELSFVKDGTRLEKFKPRLIVEMY